MIRVLTGATLIDGTGAAPVPDAAVVIDGDRITAAGPRAGASAWPATRSSSTRGGRTVIPGLIDAHDHLASHGYGLATRWGLDEPASTAHLRTARVLAETLAMGYTTVRDAGGLDAGFKLAVEQGLIPGPRLVLAVQIISPTGGIGDRVSPSGHDCCGAYDPLLPESVANGPDAVRDVVRTMVRAGADVIKTATTGGASSRPGHGPLDAAFSLAEMEALVAEVARARAAGDVPRPRRPRAAHRARGGRRFDRARVLPRRGPDPAGADGGAGHLLRAHPHRVRVPPREPGRRTCGSARSRSTRTTWPACGGRSSWACRSRPAPTRAATGTRRTRSSSSTWSRPGSRRCRRSAPATQWAAACLGLEREVGTIEKGRLADLVVVNGNPLDDVTVLLDPRAHRAGAQGRRDLRGSAQARR